MGNQKVKPNIEYNFECESCTESWSENLLDLVDTLTEPELLQIFEYIKRKLNQ